jgi:hypothetical protein
MAFEVHEDRMLARTSADTTAGGRSVLPALRLVASLAVTIAATAAGQAEPFARDCARKDIAVITMIDDHGAADDLPADRLAAAGMTMLRARSACYAGRVGEALALYQTVLDLGPVASLRQKRP